MKGGRDANKLKVFFSVLLLIIGLLAVIILVNRGIEGNVIGTLAYDLLHRCTDTDGGINIYVKGTTEFFRSDRRYKSIDKCSGTTKVIEAYCSTRTTGAFITKPCPNNYKCSNGTCIRSGNNQTNNTNGTNWNNQTNWTNNTNWWGNETNWTAGNNQTNNNTNNQTNATNSSKK